MGCHPALALNPEGRKMGGGQEAKLYEAALEGLLLLVVLRLG
jgi:hypothetical protein